ncbi:MAG: bifunctional methylenetetrahydrofolate dehydrogenase/methenyltetrahydrofolate cyclohydrolase FolD [Faecalibacterium sp.]|nr:bifunctional methylenetetrahydrofolate dehydrogenase/methenyltetrahydrofolate cyclohydrolase FolD [Ruminococcus sp.]MCM1392030.1 bifunctional methylenetetrahydrofolate dehydrogenase/methenyltetrahydrofolate cyclohydrolase FolD [Ruminococcus sp.]MCM1484837.1 bifunctional methylenetetrahydrofolate dehydrogenase/methenyltetrahydrofolate cyclohydrolase FolD [Faecalibacterium sp.]
MCKLIDGKAVSAAVKQRVKLEVEELKSQGIETALAVIIVGNDPASRVYVNNKKRACEVTGIRSVEYALGEDTTQEELLTLIDELNEDPAINGILCQLPLPKQIDEKTVIESIDPKKDVDCFSCVNVGKMWVGEGIFKPCTPQGVMELLAAYDIDVCGKNCVIIGRSNIVGKPMAALLLEKNATVTICHSRTQNLAEICKNADVIVAAVGRAKFVTADMVKDGAVLIDVGINRNEDGKLCGDIDFENVKDKASYITPVPGGCGPMTIAILMDNTVAAAKLQNSVKIGD